MALLPDGRCVTDDGPGRVIIIVRGNRWRPGRVLVQLDSGRRRYYQGNEVREEDDDRSG